MTPAPARQAHTPPRAATSHAPAESGRDLHLRVSRDARQFTRSVRAAQESPDRRHPDDPTQLLTIALTLLDETGAHAKVATRIRRDHHAGAGSDQHTARLLGEVTAHLECHARLQEAIAASPLAGSAALARSRYQRTGDGRPQLVLAVQEFSPTTGRREPVSAILDPHDGARLWCAGQRVIGLGELLAMSELVRGANVRPADAPRHLAGILRAMP